MASRALATSNESDANPRPGGGGAPAAPANSLIVFPQQGESHAARATSTTDALAAWILKRLKRGDLLGPLLGELGSDRFREFVLNEREAKRLKVDDTALVVLSTQRRT